MEEVIKIVKDFTKNNASEYSIYLNKDYSYIYRVDESLLPAITYLTFNEKDTLRFKEVLEGNYEVTKVDTGESVTFTNEKSLSNFIELLELTVPRKLF